MALYLPGDVDAFLATLGSMAVLWGIAGMIALICRLTRRKG